MRDEDRWRIESAKEIRRIVAEAMTQWTTVRFAAGQRDYLDKIALRQLKVVVSRAIDAGAAWRDVTAAIAHVAARPADRRGYVYALDDAIIAVSQDRRSREHAAAESVDRAIRDSSHEKRAAADLAALRARHPGMSVGHALQAEGFWVPVARDPR